FTGTGADLDRKILSQPPAALQPQSPAGEVLATVIAGCLEKDPSRRRQRIQNAVLEMKLSGRTAVRHDEAPRRRGSRPGPAAVVQAPKETAAPTRPPIVRMMPVHPAPPDAIDRSATPFQRALNSVF